jgi:hypothetical protein
MLFDIFEGCGFTETRNILVISVLDFFPAPGMVGIGNFAD